MVPLKDDIAQKKKDYATGCPATPDGAVQRLAVTGC